LSRRIDGGRQNCGGGESDSARTRPLEVVEAKTEVKPQTGATRDATTTHLISDEQESVDTWGVAPSKGLAMNLKKKGRFDQKSPDGDTGKRHVPPGVRAPVDGMEGVGRGNDGDKNNLASLSFGSHTEYLAETYVIIDSEVEQNGSLTMKSLLQPGIINAVTSALDEQFVERTVFFPIFTRYFLARGRLFKIMIEDLLKNKEASQNDKPP
jgi:hypothetical protein